MRTLLFLFYVLTPAGAWGKSPEVTIRFQVELPRHFNAVGRAYLSGNHPALGNWSPNGVALVRNGQSLSAAVRVPAAFPLEFKVTLGDWFHSEVREDGSEIPNHEFACLKDCSLKVRIENFRLHAPHPAPRTAAPNLYYLHDLYSRAFKNYRSLAVLVPAEYFTSPSRRFPVLYALDGNNLFDRATANHGEEWRLDETLNTLFATGELPPFLVVGIYSTPQRPEEYLSCRDPVSKLGGMAAQYGEYLRDEIKPVIDRLFRTLPDRENTAVLGSSFGGNFALFAASNFGSLFSRFAAMSPAFWWNDHCLYGVLQKPFPYTPSRVWMDMGDREGWDDGVVNFKNGVSDLKRAYDLMSLGGVVPAQNLMAWVEKGGIHHERSWGARVHRALKFLFGR